MASSKPSTASEQLPNIKTYRQWPKSSADFKGLHLLPGIQGEEIKTIAPIKGFQGGLVYPPKPQDTQTLLWHGEPFFRQGFVEMYLDKTAKAMPVSFFNSKAEKYLVGVMKSRTIVSGLTPDAVELAQISHLLHNERKSEPRVAIVQPESLEVQSNIELFKRKLGLEKMALVSPQSKTYSGALKHFAEEYKGEQGLLLWLQSPNWSDPCSFFFPEQQNKERFIDVIENVPEDKYSAIVVNESRGWLNELKLERRSELFTRFSVWSLSGPQETAAASTAKWCFILLAKVSKQKNYSVSFAAAPIPVVSQKSSLDASVKDPK